MAREVRSASEVTQEIEWLLGEYEAHMRLHRMKTTSTALETILTTTGEILESVAKFKFGSLAKSLFSLRHRKVHLLEAERAAPGRELIYLARARKRFGSR